MKKGFAPVLIILITLAILAVALTLFLKFRYSPWEEHPRELVSPPSPASDPTVNWKTFDEGPRTYKFINANFRYPEKWIQKSAATDFDSCDAYSIGPSDNSYDCGSDHFPQIYVKPLTAGDKLRCTNPKPVTVNSSSAIYCTEILQNEYKSFMYVVPKGTKIIDYFFEGKGLGNKGVSVWYTQRTNDPNLEKEFDQILSTFKFLD